MVYLAFLCLQEGVKHLDEQALLLFEGYLCYRALQDVLSLRTSHWEHLVECESSKHYCKVVLSLWF